MRQLAVLVSLGAVILGSCSLGQEPGAPSGEESPMSPPGASRPSAGGVIELTGTLGFTPIEGGCPFLEAPDGQRYEVIYPAGWRVDRGSGALTGPGGQRVAAGGIVTVRGSLASGMVSICQIGPIFEATAVVVP